LALDPYYVDGWVEGCLERIGEDHPEEEGLAGVTYEGESEEAFAEFERLGLLDSEAGAP
jgi:hypothetical protein